ncbi:uncharacterized protein METZ01_LOCUS281223 [marine metagenome]|uniref:Thioredoxin domain-containing protein n=1 Tax=marine metagenome TaxID=408172 RepID=A0A382KVP2_9ZZZZ
MKYFISTIISIFFINCNGTSYQYFDGTFDQAKAVAGSKLILIKFYTNT